MILRTGNVVGRSVGNLENAIEAESKRFNEPYWCVDSWAGVESVVAFK